MTKILFLGEIGPGQTSRMRLRAFARLGHHVEGVDTVEPLRRASWLRRVLRRRLQHDSVVDLINRSVLEAAHAFRPDIVWGEKQEFLRPETVSELHRLGAKTVHFTPDPYFSLDWKRTRLMNAALRQYDALVYCKSYERRDYEALGKPLVYMPLGFCDEVHRPLSSGDSRWQAAVGFLGGWEPRRELLLHEVIAAGIQLKIWGGHWQFLGDGKWTLRRHVILKQLAGGDAFRIHRDAALFAAWQGLEVYDDDYARALTGAKIGLGFLRKVCPDQHTTRTFEIPACGSMLLADRTDEHREFFEEGKEAEFFSSGAEMLEKVKFYVANDDARERIAKAGHAKCYSGRYAYVNRLAAALAALEGNVARG